MLTLSQTLGIMYVLDQGSNSNDYESNPLPVICNNVETSHILIHHHMSESADNNNFKNQLVQL